MSGARYGARYASAVKSTIFAGNRQSAIIPIRGIRTESGRWYCPTCTRARIFRSLTIRKDGVAQSRSFCNTTRRSEASQKHTQQSIEESESGDRTTTSPAAALPSSTAQRRWQVSRRMSRMMDELLVKAGIWGQHINVYTGTDYSGIEALRKDIELQEQKVKNSHVGIDAARAKHHEAHAKQGASQKEIVSLLERKSSWSPEDLERYMSLVRSEHTDEQAVQSAKDGLNAAERELESARAELERLERKQYREEQIWSDTIRRNSTWVTFILMGVNIVLLLAQITIFEPYRRRRIVRDVNLALEEKTLVGTATSVERQIDEVVEPKGVSLEALEAEATPAQSLDTSFTATSQPESPAVIAGDVLVESATEASDMRAAAFSQLGQHKSWTSRWEHYKEGLQDLFSERIVQVKKVDITTTALQGAATGVAAIGLLFVLWRPK